MGPLQQEVQKWMQWEELSQSKKSKTVFKCHKETVEDDLSDFSVQEKDADSDQLLFRLAKVCFIFESDSYCHVVFMLVVSNKSQKKLF